jgi:hypothetical protein
MRNNQAIQSITYILSGALLSMSASVGNTYAGSLAAILGFIIFLTGLGRLKPNLDSVGQAGVSLLSIAAIIGAASSLFDMIPIMGMLSGIGFLVAFGLELFGLLRLRASSVISETGKGGVLMLIFSMGLAIVAALASLAPFIGGFIASFFALGAIVLIFLGWTKVQVGIQEYSPN